MDHHEFCVLGFADQVVHQISALLEWQVTIELTVGVVGAIQIHDHHMFRDVVMDGVFVFRLGSIELTTLSAYASKRNSAGLHESAVGLKEEKYSKVSEGCAGPWLR